MPDAGWYRDPQDPSSEEYWDGQNWSGQRRPSTGVTNAANNPAAAPYAAGDPEQTNVQPSYGHNAPAGYGAQPGFGGQNHPQSYGSQGYPPGYGQQPYGGADQGYNQAYQPYGQPPAPVRKRRTGLLVGAGVVVVLVAAGLVTFFLWPDSSPSITYRGKPIADADQVLTRAEKAVSTAVTKDHGTKSGSSRCYFTQPKNPGDGGKASDITDSLHCGPVLFVDGDPAAEYLTIPLDAQTSGSSARLTPETTGLSDPSPTAVPSSVQLVRPDGATPPSGNGGLKVPSPPPAAKDSVAAAGLGDGETPPTLDDAVMVSKYQQVQLLAAGTVSHYGSGADARSAPSGQQLIAFQLESGDGAVSGGGTAQPVLVVDGKTHQIPPAAGDQWDVAAVPKGSTPLVQLTAGGFTQTLSLPDGKPGANNITVLTRKNTLGLVGKDFHVTSDYRKGSATGSRRLSVNLTGANLYFWPPKYSGQHPTSPGSAFLSIGIDYTYSGSSKTFGFATGLLHLRLPNGTTLTSKNIASGSSVYNVFTVPADYTTGTLTVGGSAKLDDGSTQSLAQVKRFAIHISAN